jgi:hypothetical protein
MTSKKTKVVKPEVQNFATIQESLTQFIGQPIAILCARFNYRGILSSIGEDHVVLAQARAVESSGASNQEKPTTEDPVGSSVIISLNAIELFYWPNWAYSSLED